MLSATRLDRFGTVDSSKEQDELFYSLLREMTPEQELRLVVKHMEFARRLAAVSEAVRNTKR